MTMPRQTILLLALTCTLGLGMLTAPAHAEEAAGDATAPSESHARFSYEYAVWCFAPTKKLYAECVEDFGADHTYACPDYQSNDGKSGRTIWREGCFLDWVNGLGREGWAVVGNGRVRLHNGVGGGRYPYSFERVRVRNGE